MDHGPLPWTTLCTQSIDHLVDLVHGLSLSQQIAHVLVDSIS